MHIKIAGRQTARKFINNLEQSFIDSGLKPPYLHVSDPIRSRKDYETLFDGKKLAYARFPGHPDHLKLERWLARFEGGGQFRIRSDGMNAIANTIFGLGELCGPHFIFILPLYGGTYDLAKRLEKSPRHNFRFTMLYAEDPCFLQKLYDAIDGETAAVIFEIKGNPTLTIPDVEKIVAICKNHPRRKVMVVCDDTFLFGIFHPFKWGVDIIVGSGTKYLNGESSWPIGYFGVSPECQKKFPELLTETNLWASLVGGTFGIIETSITKQLSVRDIKSRLIKHSKNAIEVAKFLENHPCVERTIYPGLPSYPHRKMLKYLDPVNGKHIFGGMISFLIKGDGKTAERFLYDLTCTSHIHYKASLAGPDDMIESADLLSHKNMSPQDKNKCGITPNLIRLSVGRIRPARETIEALDRSLRKNIR